MVEELSKTIVTIKEFTEIIEGIVRSSKLSYLDALTTYAEENDIEIESVAALVKSSHILKAKLALESEETFLLKPSGAKLPI